MQKILDITKEFRDLPIVSQGRPEIQQAYKQLIADCLDKPPTHEVRVLSPSRGNNRALAFEYIKCNAGCTVKNVSDHLCCTYEAARKHIALLLKADLIYRVDAYINKYFAGTQHKAVKQRYSPTSKLITEYIGKNPYCTTMEVHNNFNMSYSTIHYHLKRLLKNDVLVVMKGHSDRWILASSINLAK